MENKEVSLTYKQIGIAISMILALTGGEIAIGTSMFQESEGLQFVGFFLDEKTKKLKFLHTDCEIYRPIFDEKEKRYFIMLDSGLRVYCY